MTLSDGAGLGALAFTVLNTVVVLVRTSGKDGDKTGQQTARLIALEGRVTKVEGEMHETSRALGDVRVSLAAIPEQLKGQKELMTMQFEALNHAIKNMRMAMEAVVRSQTPKP